MSNRIIVLGASGYTGELVTRALVGNGLSPVVASSQKSTAAAVSERFGGLDYRIADASSRESVASLIDPGDVLVTTVGPFGRLGRVVAEAAAFAGAHYVDSTGEVGFVHHLSRDLGEPAARTGSVMLPAFGYDYVPGTIAAARALRSAGERAHSLEIGYLVRGTLDNGRGLSRGTRRTLVEELGGRAPVWEQGRLGNRRYASSITHFDVDGTSHAAVLATGTEVLFLPKHFSGLQQIRVYNGWFPHLAHPTQALSALAGVAKRTRAGQALTTHLSDRLAGITPGPDADERARASTLVVAVVRDQDGRETSRARVSGDNPYDLTAELMAWAAQMLAEGRGRRAGVVDAIQAFGLEETIEAVTSAGWCKVVDS